MSDIVSSGDRLLILAPHPDDDVLAAGGLLRIATEDGVPIRVLFLTNGECNTWAQRLAEWRLRITQHDRARWGSRRKIEALRALHCLGIPPHAAHFIGMPDGGITQFLVHHFASTVDKIANEIDGFEPTLIIAPSERDLHPDHNACGPLLHSALHVSRHGWQAHPRILSYLVHGDIRSRQRPEGTFQMQHLLDQHANLKRSAIACHSAQLQLSRHHVRNHSGKDEAFLQATPQAMHRFPFGSIRSLEFEEQFLHLRIHASPFSLVHARKALLMIFENTCRTRVVLPLQGTRPDALVLRNSGAPELRTGMISASLGKISVRLALTQDELMAGCFLKLQGMRLFFDEAGWLHLDPPSAAMPSSP